MTRLLDFAAQTFRGLITRRVRLKSDTIPYLFEDVPRRKILNAALTEGSVYVKPLYPWGWPTHLAIEPSAFCNLKCSLCPVSSGLKRPQGLMAFDTFTKILDEVGSSVFTLLFWGWGEPFLNPRAFDMIAYARSKGAKVVSSTNGHLFAREESPTGWSAPASTPSSSRSTASPNRATKDFAREVIWRRCSKGSGPWRTAKRPWGPECPSSTSA